MTASPERQGPTETGWSADRTPVSCSETCHRRQARAASCAAAMQGIASLVTSGRVQPEQVDPLIADAVALFTHHRH